MLGCFGYPNDRPQCLGVLVNNDSPTLFGDLVTNDNPRCLGDVVTNGSPRCPGNLQMVVLGVWVTWLHMVVIGVWVTWLQMVVLGVWVTWLQMVVLGVGVSWLHGHMLLTVVSHLQQYRWIRQVHPCLICSLPACLFVCICFSGLLGWTRWLPLHLPWPHANLQDQVHGRSRDHQGARVGGLRVSDDMLTLRMRSVSGVILGNLKQFLYKIMVLPCLFGHEQRMHEPCVSGRTRGESRAICPKGRLGIPDYPALASTLWPGISGLSFNYPFLSLLCSSA